MVIDDQAIDASPTEFTQAFVIRTAAITSHDNRGVQPPDALECRGGQAIAAVEATGEFDGDAAIQALARLVHDGGGGDSIAVVVAEDADPLSVANRLRKPDCGTHDRWEGGTARDDT